MLRSLLDVMQGPVAIIMLAFVGVFLLVFLIRVILTFLLDRAYRRYVALKNASKKILKPKKYIKEEEELLRKKFDIPRAHSAVKAELAAKGKGNGNYEVIESAEQDWDRRELNESQIVDIVKPIGFWTSMILGQKLTYLMQSANIINQRGQKGFWVSMIEAKERAAGKQHGRGR